MIATVINALAIVAGSAAGLVLGRFIHQKVHDTLLKSLALCVLLIAISGIVNATPSLSSRSMLVIIFSLALGALVGEVIDIDARLQRFGDGIEARLKGRGGRVSEGFVTASLVFCVGAMAVVGSLQSGLTGNHDTLFAKSVIDGITSIVFTSTLGIGVMLSAVSVFLYQGAITLAAGSLKAVLTDRAIVEMSAVGSMLILAISLNMLGVTKIKVANLLPAIAFPVVVFQPLISLLALYFPGLAA
jgi:uncharacterized membrane protein YqgA involved in biofilm formation